MNQSSHKDDTTVNLVEVMKQINELTKPYREFMTKEFFVVIGCLLYISFFVMALQFYSPNYYAMLSYFPMYYNLFLVSCHSILISLIILHFSVFTMSPETKAMYDYFAPKLFILITVIMFFSHAYLYFIAQDLICSSQDGNQEKCTIEDITFFNKLVNEQVDGMKSLRTIRSFYEKLNNDLVNGRTNIARCSNFYDSSYLQAISDHDEHQCINADFKKKKCQIGQDPQKSAPILSEFFIMTSNKTCVIGDQFDAYVSTKMIDIALNAGYRCLDFDLYPLSFAKDAIPIVTISQDASNHNMQHNYVTWQDCCKEIATNYFLSKNSYEIEMLEPLFLHLNIHPQCTQQTQDQIALLIKYYFTEYVASNVLLNSSDYNYKQRSNFGEVNICELFGKVIIMVRQVGKEIDEHTKLSTSLREVTNILNGSNIKDKEWIYLKSILNKKEFQTYTKRHLIFCRTSMFPYSKLSIEKKQSDKKHSENASELQIDAPPIYTDNVTILLTNKSTINNDPGIPIQLGCQFVSMNMSNFDDDLTKYLSFFKFSSFILKPSSLRRKPLLYTSKVESRYSGTISGVVCSTETSDLNPTEVNDATCKSQGSKEVMRIKSNDLKTSYDKNINRIHSIDKQPVFYNKTSE